MEYEQITKLAPGMVVGFRGQEHFVAAGFRDTTPSNTGGWKALGGKIGRLTLTSKEGDYVALDVGDNNIIKEYKNAYISALEITEIPGPVKLDAWRELFLSDHTKLRYNPIFQSPFTSTTIGSDPEVFAVDEKNEVIPAFDYLDKKQKFDPTEVATHMQIFYDGFQGELTTRVNCYCIGFVTDDVHTGLKRILARAKAKNPLARLTMRSVVDLPADAHERYPKKHFELGCERSYSVYGEKPVHMDDPELLRFRSAGWHMHFKPQPFELIKESQVLDAIKSLDRIIGVAMVAFGQKYNDPRRRTLYGRAGEFRHKNTIEWRTPDVIIGAHPATFNLWWDLSRKVFWLGAKGLTNMLWDTTDDETRECINSYDVTLALKILHRNEKMLTNVIRAAYPDLSPAPALAAIFEGIDAVVATPENMEANWRLNAAMSEPWPTESLGRAPWREWARTAQAWSSSGTKVV